MDPYSILVKSALITASIVIPGLAATFAAFPKGDSISLSERLGLSMVFGFVPAFMLYFFAKNLSIPINSVTVPLVIIGVTAMGIGIWMLRLGKIDLKSQSDRNIMVDNQ